MQRERLEGWMVKQIAHADLAKETVLQLPSRAYSTLKYTEDGTRAASLPNSPRKSLIASSCSPRRRLVTSQFATPTPTTTDSESPRSGAYANPSNLGLTPQSPPRQRASYTGGGDGRKNLISPNAITNHRSPEPDASTGLEKQWRAHFCDPKQTFVEHDGRVDRTKVLKWSTCLSQDGDDMDDREIGRDNPTASSSPLFLWGLPREHIVDYIRQSVLPSSWSMSAKFTGEWEAVSSEIKGKAASVQDPLVKALASLPPLSPTIGASSSPHSARRWTGGSHSSTSEYSTSQHLSGAQTARSPSKRPHTSPLQSSTTATSLNLGPIGALGSSNSTSAPASPRITSPRSDDRITRIINELRSDPSLWEAFARNVTKFQEEQRVKIRENKQRVTSPRLATTIEERKKQAEERMERNKRQREQLIRQEELRLEARLEKYQQRVAVKKKQLTAEELANTIGFRRRKVWLTAVSFVLVTNKWRTKFQHMKQVILFAKQQSRAAQTIQRLWRKWKWRHTSKHTVVIYTWLRKCMWKLLFNVRCRRKVRVASVLQRFMIDNFSGSRETRNFNRMMVKWRGKVIHSQRLGMNFVQCTRARLHALSLCWDRIDHERQRSERQQHERFVPTEEKEAEWAAMLHNRKLVKRISQRFSVSNNSSANLHSSSSTAMGGGMGSSNNFASNNNNSSPRNKNVGAGGGTLIQLEHMNEKLTTMQQVLTPFEIQRLQQNTYHIVRIAKSIKLQLLQEYLTSARKEYIQRLNHFNEQRLCVSFTREVRLDDARAIVQNSLSWGSLLVDDRRQNGSGNNGGKHAPVQPRPMLELFAGERQRKRMDELVRKGVQLTLERDHEQRFVVERQRQQRLSMDLNASSGLRPGSTKKRDSGIGIGTGGGPSSSTGSSGDALSLPGGLRKRQSSKHLAFMLPFKEEPLPKTTMLEDVDIE